MASTAAARGARRQRKLKVEALSTFRAELLALALRACVPVYRPSFTGCAVLGFPTDAYRKAALLKELWNEDLRALTVHRTSVKFWFLGQDDSSYYLSRNMPFWRG